MEISTPLHISFYWTFCFTFAYTYAIHYLAFFKGLHLISCDSVSFSWRISFYYIFRCYYRSLLPVKLLIPTSVAALTCPLLSLCWAPIIGRPLQKSYNATFLWHLWYFLKPNRSTTVLRHINLSPVFLCFSLLIHVNIVSSLLI